MNILHVSIGYPPFMGGAQTYLREMSERLVAHGHRVTVIASDIAEVDRAWSPHGRNETKLRETLNGVDVLRCPVRHFPLAPLSFYIYRRLMTGIAPHAPIRWLDRMGQLVPPMPSLEAAMEQAAASADLIHAVNITFEHPVLRAAQAAKRYRVPLVITPFVHIGEAVVERNYMMPHQIAAMHQANAVLTQTPREMAALVAAGIQLDRLQVLGMGVNLHERTPADAARFRSECDVSPDAPVVTFMGSLTYDKGAVHLLQAMPRVWEACADAVVIFAGEAPKPGGFDAALRRIAAHRQGFVKRLGVVTGKTKQSLLAATTVFVMPSRVDSFGIVYLEAWTHRKPVIGADAGGVPDVIANGEDGVIVPFGDVEALANAIVHLLKNPAEREAMGARGEQKVIRNYIWDGKYAALSNLYFQLHARAANRTSVSA